MEATGPVEIHIPVESAGVCAVDILPVAAGLSKQCIKLAMTKGAVWLTRGTKTKRLRRAKRTLRIGDELHLYYDASVLAENPVAPTLVADAGGYSVWCKPYGLRSQGSKWGDHCTVSRWAEGNLLPERPAFIVHRLDRAASGLILLGHTKTVAASLSGLFKNRAIEKRYRAAVSGKFPERPDPIRIVAPIDKKEAISEFSLTSYSDDGTKSFLDVRIETGRKHQIRRHLADLGHPILGDRLYGNGVDDGVDLQLTAYRLAFLCPIAARPVEFRVPAKVLSSERGSNVSVD